MTGIPHQKTWLITGASSGLGKSLARHVLGQGHLVLGTTRTVDRAKEQYPGFEKEGGVWVAMDPGRADTYDSVLKMMEKHEIDVVVNNAGFAFIGGVENSSEEEVRSQMEVNFYGPLRLIRAILPQMRQRRSGDIVLISSGAGFVARPGRGTYSASKFAIEAIHESLSHEVASFAIRVLIVEPGAFRTPFASNIVTPFKYRQSGGYSEDYRGTCVEQMVGALVNSEQFLESVRGDPGRAAKAIFTSVENGHEYLRLPLGHDCVAALEEKIESLRGDLNLTRQLAMSTSVD
ncbi:hypothetical protein POX_c04739 [Penicillium oxalicum]|uniref:hypothetical protein n=1 Tax=Penicillium oxalicum TaxID=69781 RepID=UPI0020B789E8|nr:hypothetical protein POX_c04739 [Penicillium oxalicum]KAI2791859.1 hypothetical protein POX_c04739 [Penicillium oxalicum]